MLLGHSLKRHFIRAHVNYAYLCETDIVNCGINLQASPSVAAWSKNGKAEVDCAVEPSTSNSNVTSGRMVGLYACHTCILFFTQLTSLRKHVSTLHTDEAVASSATTDSPRLQCDHCEQKFVKKSTLVSHISHVHSSIERNRKQQNQSSQLQQQPSNSSSTTSANKNANHQWSVSNKRPRTKSPVPSVVEGRRSKRAKGDSDASKNKKGVFYDCAQCHETFYSNANLCRHMQTVHKTVKSSKIRSLASTATGDRKWQHFSHTNPEDVGYFSTVSKQIADNLLNHVDGKLPQTSTSTSTSTSASTSTSETTPSNCSLRRSSRIHPSVATVETPSPSTSGQSLDLSQFNFAPSTQLDRSKSPVSSEEQAKLEYLHANELQSKRNMPVVTIASDFKTVSNVKSDDYNYVCTVCCNRCPDKVSFWHHWQNNHPNVYCSYVRVEAGNEVPSQLLLWRYNSPNGLLKSCQIASYPGTSKTNTQVHCTKCHSIFQSIDQLHSHILDCAKKQSKLSASTANKTTSNIEDEETEVDESEPTATKVTSDAEQSNEQSTLVVDEPPDDQLDDPMDEPTEEEDQDIAKEPGEDEPCTESDSSTAAEKKPDPWKAKQEYTAYAFKGSPAQFHSCPYCQRGFTYLANYRKHIKGICPIRQQIEDRKKVLLTAGDSGQGESLEQPSTTKEADREGEGDDDSGSNLTITTEAQSADEHEERQSQVLPEQEQQQPNLQQQQQPMSSSTSTAASKLLIKKLPNSTSAPTPADPGRIRCRKFSGETPTTHKCHICQKVYKTYLDVWKHRLSHKLGSDTSANSGKSTASTSEEAEVSRETEASASDAKSIITSSEDKSE